MRRCRNGRKSADRVPTTSSPPSLCSRRMYVSVRRSTVSLEWYAVTRLPKTRSIRSTSCAVKAISGTSINTSPPAERVSAIRSIYISVLPEPVTPRSRCVVTPAAHDARISAATRPCASLRRGGVKRTRPPLSARRSRSVTSTYPALRSAERIAASISSRRRGTAPSVSRPSSPNAAIVSKTSQRRGARRRMRSHSAASRSASRHAPDRATYCSVRGRNTSAENSSSDAPRGLASDGSAIRITSPRVHI